MPIETPIKIGDWIRRVYDRRDYRSTKPHKVDSTTRSGLFTACGRYLKFETRTKVGNHFEQVNYLDRQDDGCRGCIGKHYR